MKTYLFFIPFLLLHSGVFSQTTRINASLILNNDSVKEGLLQYEDWEKTPDNIQFKGTGQSTFINYTPIDIKAFTNKEFTYISAVVVIEKKSVETENLEHELKYDTITQKVFLKQLVSGKKQLFQYITWKGVHNYYIRLDNDSLLLLNFKRFINENSRIEEIEKYKNQLSFYLADCLEIQNDINKMTYDENSFIKIFERYNECSKSNVAISKAIKPGLNVDLFAGLTNTKINFLGSSELPFAGSTYPASNNFTGLVSFALSIPRKFLSRHFVFELGIKNMHLIGKDNFRGGFGANYMLSVNYKYTYLKSNFLFRKYLITKKRFSGFGDFGISYGNRINLDGTAINLSNGVELKSYKGLLASDGNVTLGIGTSFAKKILGLVRFEYGNLFSFRNEVSSNIYSWYLLIGYRLR